MNDDIHALTGAYAVDAVDDVERIAFERHLAACPDCREEVASLQSAALQLAVLIQATPPESLREQVLRDISAVRPLPPEVRREAGDRIEATGRAGRHAAPRQRRPRRWLAAAAAVVVLGGGAGVLAWHPWDRTSQTQLTVADQVQQAADRQVFSTAVSGGGTVTVVRSKSVGRAVLLTDRLPDAGSGKTYQMWLQVPGGNFASAGLVPGAGTQTVLLNGDAGSAVGAGVSVEPSSGSAQPTSPPIALFPFA